MCLEGTVRNVLDDLFSKQSWRNRYPNDSQNERQRRENLTEGTAYGLMEGFHGKLWVTVLLNTEHTADVLRNLRVLF
jgi:hypothetical protein